MNALGSALSAIFTSPAGVVAAAVGGVVAKVGEGGRLPMPPVVGWDVFPWEVTAGVFLCGHNDRRSFGAHSWFVPGPAGGFLGEDDVGEARPADGGWSAATESIHASTPVRTAAADLSTLSGASKTIAA